MEMCYNFTKSLRICIIFRKVVFAVFREEPCLDWNVLLVFVISREKILFGNHELFRLRVDFLFLAQLRAQLAAQSAVQLAATAGVCAGIAMAGNFLATCKNKKDPNTPDKYLLGRKLQCVRNLAGIAGNLGEPDASMLCRDLHKISRGCF